MVDIAELQKLEVGPELREFWDDEPLWCRPPCAYFSSVE
jgi:hypothetical protein